MVAPQAPRHPGAGWAARARGRLAACVAWNKLSGTLQREKNAGHCRLNWLFLVLCQILKLAICFEPRHAQQRSSACAKRRAGRMRPLTELMSGCRTHSLLLTDRPHESCCNSRRFSLAARQGTRVARFLCVVSVPLQNKMLGVPAQLGRGVHMHSSTCMRSQNWRSVRPLCSSTGNLLAALWH